MIRDDGRLQKARKFDPAVAVGHTHHRNFDELIA